MSAATDIVYRKLKNENHKLKEEILTRVRFEVEQAEEIKRLREFIIEFAVRAQIRIPETNEQMSWFGEQFSFKFSDFVERLNEICTNR